MTDASGMPDWLFNSFALGLLGLLLAGIAVPLSLLCYPPWPSCRM